MGSKDEARYSNHDTLKKRPSYSIPHTNNNNKKTLTKRPTLIKVVILRNNTKPNYFTPKLPKKSSSSAEASDRPFFNATGGPTVAGACSHVPSSHETTARYVYRN